MNVNLVSPEGVRFEGEAKSVSLPSWDGQLGVLSGHAPMIGLLGCGEVRITGQDAAGESYFLEGGVFMITRTAVTLLTENCDTKPLEQTANGGSIDVDEIWEQMQDSEGSQQPV